MVRKIELTKGEKVFLQRRRNEENQTKAAKRHKVGLVEYRAWESDESKEIPVVGLGKITVQETCVILRRREGLGVTELAKKLKRCRFWVGMLERGEAPVDELAKFWKVSTAA